MSDDSEKTGATVKQVSKAVWCSYDSKFKLVQQYKNMNNM